MSDEYRSMKAINATAIKAGMKSMLHMHHAMTGPGIEPTASMTWGTNLHAMTLTPERVAIFAGARRAGKSWEEFRDANGRKTILTQADVDRLAPVAEKCRAVINGTIGFGNPCDLERQIWWNDRDGLTGCKALPDVYCHDSATLIDIKTARDISERAFTAASWSAGYHLQMAWYMHGLKSVGKPVERVGILAVENKAPHDMRMYWMDSRLLAFGLVECFRIVEKYKAALKAGEFPGQYQTDGQLIQPEWADGQVQALAMDEMDASEI
jgi:hypothetical protein